MAKIKVDVEALRGNRAELENKIEEISQYNAELEKLIYQIHDGWQGASSEAYYQMMLGYQRRTVSMQQVLEEFKKYVEQAASQFETMDQQGAARIRQSF